MRMFHTMFAALALLASLIPAANAGEERHTFTITDSSVIDWLSDADACEAKEAEFQCLSHGDPYVVKAKMFKDCTGKYVYIEASAVKKGDVGSADATPGFALTKVAAAKDCPTPDSCSLDTRAVCPLLDVAEVLNSDLVVIQREE
jgi:hypothetical protein